MNEIKVSTVSRERKDGQKRDMQRRAGGEAKRAKKAPDDRVVPRMNKMNWRRKAHTHKHRGDTNKRQVNRGRRIW